MRKEVDTIACCHTSLSVNSAGHEVQCTVGAQCTALPQSPQQVGKDGFVGDLTAFFFPTDYPTTKMGLKTGNKFNYKKNKWWKDGRKMQGRAEDYAHVHTHARTHAHTRERGGREILSFKFPSHISAILKSWLGEHMFPEAMSNSVIKGLF